MDSTSPRRIPRLPQLRMNIVPSGPVSNSSVCRTSSASDTSFRPKPRLAHNSASPEITFAPARTTFENSDTANKVLLTYVSLTSSVITSATSESMGLTAGAGLLAISAGFQRGRRLYCALWRATTAGALWAHVRAAPESRVTSRGNDGGNCGTPRRVCIGRLGFGFRVGPVRHRQRHRANSDFHLSVAAVRSGASRVDARGGGDVDGAGSAERGGINSQAACARQFRLGVLPDLGRGYFCRRADRNRAPPVGLD